MGVIKVCLGLFITIIIVLAVKHDEVSVSPSFLLQIQKRLLAAHPDDLSLLTDLGILYELAERSELSKPIFEKVQFTLQLQLR